MIDLGVCSRKIGLAVFTLIFFNSCSPSNRFTQGKVSPRKFHSSVTFFTAKSLVIIPCELNGVSKNFIFDTGAQVTAIQRDSIFGEIVTVRGGTNRTVENGTETVESLKIGSVDFVNTFATNGDEAGLKDKIPNFGGILGRTIIDKANWLINYPNRTIELSDKELTDNSYSNIQLTQSSGAPYVYITIDNKEYKAIIDLGSSSVFNVPQDTELAKTLINKYAFEKNTRERYTVGGTQNITELIGKVPLLTIGDLVFENTHVNINQSSQIRLGIALFKNYMIYIDNINHRYRIKAAD